MPFPTRGRWFIYQRSGSAGGDPQDTLVWVDRNGKEEPLGAPPNAYDMAQFISGWNAIGFEHSCRPEYRHLDLGSGSQNIDQTDLRFGRSTSSPFGLLMVNESPLWRFRNGRFGIFWKAADGSGKEELLSSPADRVFFPWSWLDNGKILVLVERSSSANIGIYRQKVTSKWKPLLEEKYNEDQPQISPDGRWMSYVSDESGQV